MKTLAIARTSLAKNSSSSSSGNPATSMFSFILNTSFNCFFPCFFCVCLFYATVVVVVVVVVVVEMFLPTNFYTSCIIVAGEGTSPFCHSCIPLD